jgi:hypothetical protein
MSTINTMNPMGASTAPASPVPGHGASSASINSSLVSSGNRDEDSDKDILQVGDTFRLRSVKFPDYEMGVTSVKLRDEFSYMGLRKVSIPRHFVFSAHC